MEPMLSMNKYPPDMKQYLQDHRLPTIMEALLTGLIVMLPYDPWQFVREKLAELRDDNETEVSWDMFVDKNMREKLHNSRRGKLDLFLDDTDLPAEDVLLAVYQFRRNNLFKTHFKAWFEFHLIERKANEAYNVRLGQAKQYYSMKITRLLFRRWKIYTDHKAKSVNIGYLKLQQTANQYMIKIAFSAWLKDFKETRRAKRWFNRKGIALNGENEDEEGEWYWPEGEDPISLLPREAAIKIFSQVNVRSLGRCAQVCRAWKDLSEDKELWTKVDLSWFKSFVCDSVIMRLFHKCRPLLGHLNLNGCSQLTDESLKHIGYCNNLQDLNLSECNKLNDRAMEQIAKGCSGLLYLNLSYCYVTDSIIKILSKYCASLHYLSLAYSNQFTSKGLESITVGKGCRRLVYLDLSGCTQLSTDGIQHIGKGCPILNTLILDDLPHLTDSVVLKLVANCHTLRHISFLGEVSTITDRAFKYLAMENKKLRTIKIENNSTITDVTLRAFGKGCRELSHLYLAGCSRLSDQGLRALKSLRKLQVLNIADCTRVSDAGIRNVIENSPGDVLRELNLTNLIKISDITLLRMSQNLKCLTYVCFCYCEHISNTGVELLGHMPWLVGLDLTGCNISDKGVASLRNNPQFRHLALAELLDITDDGLQTMCSTLDKLDTLDLSNCENITNTGLQTVAYKCHFLRTLHIANCPRIDDEGIKLLSLGCSFLVRLDMSGCNVTNRALRHLVKGCANLSRLDVLSCVNITRDVVRKFQGKDLEINYNTDEGKYFQHSIQEIQNLPVEPLLDRI